MTGTGRLRPCYCVSRAQFLESLSSLHSTLEGILKRNVAVEGWLDRHQFSWLALVCLMRGLWWSGI